MDFPYVVYWVNSMAQTRQDIEKPSLPLLRESKMKRFLSNVWHLKFSFFFPLPNSHFLPKI